MPVSKHVSAVMLYSDVFFKGSWEEQISGESTAAHFDLSKEHVIRIPTAAFCTQPSIVSMSVCQNKSPLPNNVKISLGQAQFSQRIMSFCSKSKITISPSQLDTSVQRAWSHGATRITWSSTSTSLQHTSRWEPKTGVTGSLRYKP